MARDAAIVAGPNRRPAHKQRARLGRRNFGVSAAKETIAQTDGRLNGITLDAGALIALDRRDRRLAALLARAQERGARITIPATALAQAIRNPARQAVIARLIRHTGTDLVPLDGPDATKVGLLLAHAATADIVDAHVIVCASRAGQPVITSDPDDLRRIAPELELVVV